MTIDEKLDITDLERCADNFYKTIRTAKKIESGVAKMPFDEDGDLDFAFKFARSAVIQVYEITVENAWKMMQRWIKINFDNRIQEKPKRELFRSAHQCGLIADPVVWWDFYEGKNKTSHTYHEDIANEVYHLAKKLPKHLKDFIKRLEARR